MTARWGRMMIALLLAASPAASALAAGAEALPALPGAVQPVQLWVFPGEDPICTPLYSACTAIEDGEEIKQKANGACIHICYAIYECYDVACGDPYPTYHRAEERQNMGVYPRGHCPGMPEGPPELPLCRRPPPGAWVSGE